MANYVKFVRGSSEAFAKLANKASDTLYFITNSDGSVSLYLGNKLISDGDGSGSIDLENFSIDALKDVMIDELKDKSLLVY
jgi:hypothetical protein